MHKNTVFLLLSFLNTSFNISFRDCPVAERLRRSIQQFKHIINDLPQTVLQRKVIVHQIDEEVVVMDILDDHP